MNILALYFIDKREKGDEKERGEDNDCGSNVPDLSHELFIKYLHISILLSEGVSMRAPTLRS